MKVILVDVRWYIIVTSAFISLTIAFFIYFFDYLNVFWDLSIHILYPFLIKLFQYYWIVLVPYLFWPLTLYQINGLIFSPVSCVIFFFLMTLLLCLIFLVGYDSLFSFGFSSCVLGDMSKFFLRSMLKFLKFICFYFVCLSILPACKCARVLQCPQRLEEGITSPGTGVRNNC